MPCQDTACTCTLKYTATNTVPNTVSRYACKIAKRGGYRISIRTNRQSTLNIVTPATTTKNKLPQMYKFRQKFSMGVTYDCVSKNVALELRCSFTSLPPFSWPSLWRRRTIFNLLLWLIWSATSLALFLLLLLRVRLLCTKTDVINFSFDPSTRNEADVQQHLKCQRQVQSQGRDAYPLAIVWRLLTSVADCSSNTAKGRRCSWDPPKFRLQKHAEIWKLSDRLNEN